MVITWYHQVPADAILVIDAEIMLDARMVPSPPLFLSLLTPPPPHFDGQTFTWNLLSCTGHYLKEYSAILTAPFYSINQKILTKRLFTKSQLILSLLQVMHGYVRRLCSIDCCVK